MAKSPGAKKKARAPKKAQAPKTPPRRLRPVSPDSVDFRDRLYMPDVSHAPAATLLPVKAALRPVLDQARSDACTGFALATVVHVLTGQRDGNLPAPVAPFMLYGMARRYDNLPGTDPTEGSTCRGALKGWFKHGVCADLHWPKLAEPSKRIGGKDWWDEAVQRPLGAYYRVDPRSVVDMQIALNEVGVLYVSAETHAGWDEGVDLPSSAKPKHGYWVMPYTRGAAPDGGHAFALVGYDATGFIIQNSWGTSWGSEGLAIMTYDDWLAHGYDCWVAQLGVVTEHHKEAAAGGVPAHRPLTASHAGVLDIHALSPYIINTANNGELSASGDFHTREEDIAELCNTLIPLHRKEWGIPANQPLDVALYAHGGLCDERNAAETAARWIPLLKQAHVFPVFFMWESGLLDTLLDEIKDGFKRDGEVAVTGAMDRLKAWWSDRVENMARVIAKGRWGEMKENGRLLSQNAQGKGGAQLLTKALLPRRKEVRLHLIGHSAGAVIHAYLAEKLAREGWTIESLSLMAPAVRMDVFDATLLPLVKQKKIGRMAQFHLGDALEDNEGGMKIALGYKRSLLYMISNGLEEQRGLPILGMQKFFDRDLPPLANVQQRVAPGSAATRATRHGDFDDDAATCQSVVAHVLNQPMPA